MSEQGFSTPLSALDAVVLDTETTGLDARTARVVQIGAVRVRGAKVLDAEIFGRLVNPGVPIPKATTAIHGIADADVADKPGFSDLLDELDRYLGSSIVIGHTIGYDLTILDREARLANRLLRPRRSLDVRTLAELARPNLAQYDLDRIAASLGIAIVGRHTAMGDALATAHVFTALLPLLRARGIRTIAEAEAASRRLADRQAGASSLPLTAPAAVAGPLPALARIDSFTYTHRVADVMSSPAVWCAPTATVHEVVRLLMERRISSVLIRFEDGQVGIATERDMLRAIDRSAQGALDAPVAQLASRPLQTIAADDLVYRAVGRLDRLGMRHLGVTDASGEVVGLITSRNLLKHRASTAVALGDAIDRATSEQELGRAWGSLALVARTLLAEEVDARRIAAVISGEICALTRRAAEIAEARMREAGKGAPPVPYALAVLGSAGRSESLLAADQDNALVYAEGEPDGPEDRWFTEMATHVAAILDEVGVPFCKGGVMAKTREWRHSLAGWQEVIDGWIRRQRPEDILNVDIFFDGVTVHGDPTLGDSIFARALDAAAGSVTFQKQLTANVTRWQAPITFLGNLRTDEDGRIDLKKFGLLPIFTAGRALAIKHANPARSTPDRLRAAVAQGQGSPADVEALIEAHGVVMRAMLEQQLIDGEAGIPLTPRVDLKRLGPERRSELKDALKRVSIAVDLVNEGRI